MFLGIEIGGTKLQLGLGRGDGQIVALERRVIDPAYGAQGIRQQILAVVPELLTQAKLARSDVAGIGIGFGGPTEDATQSVITSHQVAGWDNFPLAQWAQEELGRPTVICNDADTAGLGEAMFGAGQGLSPIFYVTVGTGVGGGLIVNGEIYRGIGRGAAEIGHLRYRDDTVENYSSGRGIELHAARERSRHRVDGPRLSARDVAVAAAAGDALAQRVLDQALEALASGLCSVIALVCPRRIVIGGGVSLLGESQFFAPLRAKVTANVFAPFAGLTDIVPAALGEEVVVHGALALAHGKFGR